MPAFTCQFCPDPCPLGAAHFTFKGVYGWWGDPLTCWTSTPGRRRRRRRRRRQWLSDVLCCVERGLSGGVRCSYVCGVTANSWRYETEPTAEGQWSELWSGAEDFGQQKGPQQLIRSSSLEGNVTACAEQRREADSCEEIAPVEAHLIATG